MNKLICLAMTLLLFSGVGFSQIRPHQIKSGESGDVLVSIGGLVTNQRSPVLLDTQQVASYLPGDIVKIIATGEMYRAVIAAPYPFDVNGAAWFPIDTKLNQSQVQAFEADQSALSAISDSTVSVKDYAENLRRRSRIGVSLLPNLAYEISADVATRSNIWFNGDSKLNAVHTSSKIQADFGHYFGFGGTGYLSLSTFNNGRLGLIPRGTGGTRVEYPAEPLARYSLDGHAQLLTGSEEIRIEPNDNYTTYTENKECQYWDYAKISYLRHPSGGSLQVFIDGNLITTLGTSGSESKLFYEITGLADTSHILTIRNASGTNYTLDAYFLRSQKKAPVVNVVANSGFDASQWVDLFGVADKTFLTDNPPTTVAVRLGANDSNRGFTPSEFAENVARIVDTFRNYNPICDVAIIGIEGMGLGVTFTDQQYNDALDSLSVDGSYLSFSLLDAIPDMTEFQARGFSDDGTHENQNGSHLVGGYIVQNLLSANGKRSGGASSIPSFQQVTNVGSTTSEELGIFNRINVNSTGNNILLGQQTGRVRTTFGSSVIAGYQSAYNLTSGNSNTLYGYQSGYRLTTGQKNNVFGTQAFFNNRTGSDNLAIGSQSGSNDANNQAAFTIDQSIFLGALSGPKSDNTTNEIVIGYNSEGNGPNSATLGGPDTDSTFLKGDVHAQELIVKDDINARFSYLRSAYLRNSSLPTLEISEDAGGGGFGAQIQLTHGTIGQQWRLTNHYQNIYGSGAFVIRDHTNTNTPFEIETGTGEINFGRNVDYHGFRATGAGDPVGGQDYVTLNYFNANQTGGSSLWTANGSDAYYNNGFVGIGTITPDVDLHVKSETLNVEAKIEAAQFATFRISSDLSNTGNRDPSLRFSTQGVERWRLGVDQSTGNGFAFSSGGLSSAAAIFIREDNDRVGLGVNPQRRLDINGDLRMRSISPGVPTTILGWDSADGDVVDGSSLIPDLADWSTLPAIQDVITGTHHIRGATGSISKTSFQGGFPTVIEDGTANGTSYEPGNIRVNQGGQEANFVIDPVADVFGVSGGAQYQTESPGEDYSVQVYRTTGTSSYETQMPYAGHAVFIDTTYKAANPITITSGAWVRLPMANQKRDTLFAPVVLRSDLSGGLFRASDTTYQAPKVGAQGFIRIDFSLESNNIVGNTTGMEIVLDIRGGVGAVAHYVQPVLRQARQNYSVTIPIFARGTALANGYQIQLRATGDDIEVRGQTKLDGTEEGIKVNVFWN